MGVTKIKQKDGVFILKMEGVAGLMSWPYRVFTIAFYVWMLCFLNAILPVQLYFRYYSLVRNRILSGASTIGLCAVAALTTFPVFACTYLSFGWSSEEQHGFNYGTLWYKEFPMPQLLFGDARSPYQKGFLFLGGGVIGASYVLAMIIGYRTLQRIRNMNDSYSEKTRRLQRQLTNFMILQAVIPLFTSVLPVMIIVSPSLFYTDDGRLCFYSVIIISWIPVVNPIITVLVIVPFRKIVFRAVASKGTGPTSHTSGPENAII
uniref:G_PROTEIN_RECEP_F1_2 domain-containing protein n=1 Tax=Bursaphelenchus xylophilus TaxID=6326 RepID=A0A1I7RJW8_BURXY